MPLNALSDLDKFKSTPFSAQYPADLRTFYSPVDEVHDVLLAVIGAASRSVVLSMYGYDDDELDSALQQKVSDPSISCR